MLKLLKIFYYLSFFILRNIFNISLITNGTSEINITRIQSFNVNA